MKHWDIRISDLFLRRPPEVLASLAEILACLLDRQGGRTDPSDFWRRDSDFVLRMKNIYLIGMMGSGKSVTGKHLAKLLHCDFADVDELVQERTARTITEIFEKEGEPFFRGKEKEILKEVSEKGPAVVATGGGTVLLSENIQRMKSTGKVIYLQTSLETLWQRVRTKRDRPLLKHEDPKTLLATIFEKRRTLYAGTCDIRVTTDGRTALAVAQEIFEILEKRLWNPCR